MAARTGFRNGHKTHPEHLLTSEKHSLPKPIILASFPQLRQSYHQGSTLFRFFKTKGYYIMKKFLVAAAPLALLGACSGGGSEGGSEGLQAGEWTMTTEMTEIEIPGMPEEMVAQMREQMGEQSESTTRCITEEEAADPGANLFTPDDADQDCDFGESTVADGVINIAGTCEAPGGQGTATMAINGSYTATTMTAELSVNVEGGPMAMNMAGNMSAERTGDCAAEPTADS